jgi:prevent-host-death family protein
VDYVTVRDLREKSGDIWQRVDMGEEFVVTRNGKPIALLVPVEPAQVEGRLRALRASAFGDLLHRIQRGAQRGQTPVMSEEEINAEIAVARAERALAARAPQAAEPGPAAYGSRQQPAQHKPSDSNEGP